MPGQRHRPRNTQQSTARGGDEEQAPVREQQPNGPQGQQPEGGAEQQTPRQRFVGEYRTFLASRRTEAQQLTGEAQVQRVQGLLLQVETVSAQLQQGQVPDIATLSTTPTATATTSQTRGFVPPEWVAEVRPLIQMLEVGVPGAEASEQAPIEGSRHSADDWNSRLGVPQYRTQSDNLATPEATCNVTSFSMVLERLGYSRADVMAALERQLKIRYLRSLRRDPNREDLSQVELPDDRWETEIRAYLDTQNNAQRAYQRIRGGTTSNAQRAELSGEFRENAQMEDVLDFLLQVLGISRYSINGNAATVLGRVEPDANERPGVETFHRGGRNTWRNLKPQVQTALDQGGSSMLSVFHKGAGNNGTHIIAVQRVTGSGVVVDDPYGEIRATYRRDQHGDAYTNPRSTRAASGLKNTQENVDTDRDGFDDDWKVARAQNAGANETRGESVELSDAQVEGMMNYLTIFRRAGAQGQQRAAG